MNEVSPEWLYMDRLISLRHRVGVKDQMPMARLLNIPTATYKNWEAKTRRPSTVLLSSIIDSNDFNPFFSYLLLGDKDGLSAQKSLERPDLDTATPGERLMAVRKGAGIKRQSFVSYFGYKLNTIKYYETGIREKMPLSLMMDIAKHPEFNPFIVYIASGVGHELMRQRHPE